MKYRVLEDFSSPWLANQMGKGDFVKSKQGETVEVPYIYGKRFPHRLQPVGSPSEHEMDQDRARQEGAKEKTDEVIEVSNPAPVNEPEPEVTTDDPEE